MPWSPSDIPTGLTSWFDSSDAATLTFAGANVTQWGDKSPAGNHAFPFVSGPTITIFDSKPMLFIRAGAASAMHTTVARSYGDFTAAVFFKKGTDQQFQRLIDTEIDTGFWLGRGPNSGQWGGGVIEISSPFGQYRAGISRGRPLAGATGESAYGFRRQPFRYENWLNDNSGKPSPRHRLNLFWFDQYRRSSRHRRNPDLDQGAARLGEG